jgi:hypothetical protein
VVLGDRQRRDVLHLRGAGQDILCAGSDGDRLHFDELGAQPLGQEAGEFRGGADGAAGQRAAALCTDMLAMPEWEPVARVLHRVLAGEDPIAAFAAAPELPDDLRQRIQVALLAE